MTAKISNKTHCNVYGLTARSSNVALGRRRYMVTPMDKRILLRTGLYQLFLDNPVSAGRK